MLSRVAVTFMNNSAVYENFKLGNIPKFSRIANAFKYYTSNTTLTFKSNYTEDEEAKILHTLNQCNSEHLTRFNVPQSRVKRIQKYVMKMGPFKSLSEVLEVEGLSQNVLNKICQQIISNNGAVSEVASQEAKPKLKRFKQLVKPVCDQKTFQQINSVTGIYLSVTGVSWARIHKLDNSLTHWNMNQFHELPKKMTMVDTFNSAIELFQKIPSSDIYVLESISSLPPNGQSQSIMVSSHNELQDLTAILLTLLNTSAIHNASLKGQDSVTSNEFIENKVYFLKSKLPARLFSLLIGNEKVSALNIVSQLLEKSSENFDLPCTPITVDRSVKGTFDDNPTSNKELLGQALLLLVTFMDLFVYNNFKSWSVLSTNNKRI